MRNSKKLIAVIMTVALLASMMVPALAATYQTEADNLTNAGLMNGTPGTGLETLLTRDQGITFTVRAMGSAAAADAMTVGAIALQTDKLTDGAAVPGWATNYAAFAIEQGITNGNRINADGKITFSPKDPLSGKQFITMMLRSLGYIGVTLDNCLEKAIASGMLGAGAVVEFGMKAQLTRDDAAAIIYSTVNNGNVALANGLSVGAVKLVNSLVAKGALTTASAVAGKFSNYVAPTPVAAALLTVSTVTATNLKEIYVKFSAAPDKTTAETTTNYVLSTGTVSGAALVGDTVTLTVNGSIANQTAVDVTTSNVKSAAGVAMVAVTKTVTMFDATLPTFVSYEFTGPTTIELTYSEPIKTAGTATVDSGVYGASAALYGTAKNNVVVVTLGTAIPAGIHTLKMVGVADYAYTALDATISITYAANTTAPTVTLTSATQTSVTLTFSKAVTGIIAAGTNFYHSYTAYTPTSVKDADGNAVIATNYYSVVVLSFKDSPLPAGLATVHVLKTVGTVTITDRWGNVMAADAALTATITADVTAPTATVAATAETTVVVTYSEDVTLATVKDKANYVFKLASTGAVIAPAANAIAYDATTFKATITFATLAGGAYTVAISGVKDVSLSANAIATVTLPFTISDLTPITTITSAYSVETAAAGADYIYVTFPELMKTSGTGSILDVANYKIGTLATNAVALPTDSTIALFGTTGKIKITVAGGVGAADLTGKKLFVRNLADAAGNVMSLLYIEKAITADAAPAITAVKTTALNKLELTVNRDLSAVVASNIWVTASGAALQVAFATYTNAADATKIFVTLNAASVLANEGSTPSAIQVTGGGILADTGTAMANNLNILTTITPTDGIAPALVATTPITTYDVTGNGQLDTIVVAYTEAMKRTSVSDLSYAVAGYAVTTAYVVSTSSAVNASKMAPGAVDGNYVVIKVTELTTADTNATPGVTQVYPITDVAGNILVAQAALVSTDTAGPAIIGVSALTSTGGLVVTGSTIAVTFSETVTSAGTITTTAAVATSGGSLSITGLGAFTSGGAITVAGANIVFTKVLNDTGTILTLTVTSTSAPTMKYLDDSNNATFAVSSGITDLLGNALVSNTVVSGAYIVAVAP